ncbi:MAG: hypothetical protein L3J39_16525 [Verrucomicrobiales bacterium]|nr:hypothetical protein [Verrucomicrobiales bacterium]
MAFKFYTRKFQRAGAVLLSLYLMLVISGVVGIIFQGVAWVDMSQKSGGIRYLAQVVFEAEPCYLCETAQELLNQKGGEPDPKKMNRLKLSKLSLCAELKWDDVELCLPQNITFTETELWSLKEFVAELSLPPPKA